MSGCLLGTSLIFNIKALERRISDNSSVTKLKGTEEFMAAMVDNIIIVGVLNGIIVLSYLAEFARTCAWKATPNFDIMNDSDFIVAAFEGGRLLEKCVKHTSTHDGYDDERTSYNKHTPRSDYIALVDHPGDSTYEIARPSHFEQAMSACNADTTYSFFFATFVTGVVPLTGQRMLGSAQEQYKYSVSSDQPQEDD
ncbi:hypothetical protein BKA66DRAFT_445293 [Pyrenochaeta sp. MPI-SDFR-AT-0127]|nr:hypothetical protein BKA66DRAFT_445293 [Pyrenochaeta sp. MPI-SDFR-AT-0127]